MRAKVREEFIRRAGTKVREQILGAQLSTYAIGGAVEFLLEPDSVEQIATSVQVLTDLGQQFRILGAGSNVLISSQGISGWCIRLGRGLRFLKPLGAGRYTVGAAMSLMALSRDLSDQGFSGLEFAGGIPGSLGGAVRMNAGAHGSQMSEIVESVSYVDAQGNLQQVDAGNIHFAYRHSDLPSHAIIVSATLRLSEVDREETKARRNEFLMERKRQQPLTLPSAGSVFKNPPGPYSAGYYIDQCGLKGLSQGGAQISDVHANWIVNPERKAEHTDVLWLMEHCRTEVLKSFGITLTHEVVLWCQESEFGLS